MKVEGRIIIGDSRNMAELADESVDLIVTSPPYWHIKDYGIPGQIGYGQSLHEYLLDLSCVFKECFRVLKPGRRLCVNIGDQFARAVIYGRYKVIPLHAEVIAQCEAIGFDYMGAIIWQKRTTMRTTGGAVVMGSFPYPPNGIVELDYEFILLFKKPGKALLPSKEAREASKLTKEEWKEFFSGHWRFGGERQVLHESMFPEELPRRLIKMFSLLGETVLDPFLGSGTTVKVALELGRNAVGYEIQPDFLPIIEEKLGLKGDALLKPLVSVERRERPLPPVEPPPNYRPQVKDARPLFEPSKFKFGEGETYKVVEVLDERTLLLDSGLKVKLLGIIVPRNRREEALSYLRKFVLGKKVLLKFDKPQKEPDGSLPAYLYLANKIFINRKMIEMGLADADKSDRHRYLDKFVKAEGRRRAKGVKVCGKTGRSHSKVRSPVG